MDKARDYEVLFELFGKRMKTTVLAKDEDTAKEIIKNKIKFHLIYKANTDFNSCVDLLDDAINCINNAST